MVMGRSRRITDSISNVISRACRPGGCDAGAWLSGEPVRRRRLRRPRSRGVLGADRIEIYTGPYAVTLPKAMWMQRWRRARYGQACAGAGIGVHAAMTCRSRISRHFSGVFRNREVVDWSRAFREAIYDGLDATVLLLRITPGFARDSLDQA